MHTPAWNITWKYNLHWSNYLFTYFPYFSEFNPPNSTKIVFLGQSFIFRCNVTLSVWPFETASQANTLRQTQTLWNRQTCRHFEMNKHWSRQTGPHGAVVSALGYGSGGPGFKSHQRRGNFLTLDRLQVQPRVSDCGLNGKTKTTQSSLIHSEHVALITWPTLQVSVVANEAYDFVIICAKGEHKFSQILFYDVSEVFSLASCWCKQCIMLYFELEFSCQFDFVFWYCHIRLKFLIWDYF